MPAKKHSTAIANDSTAATASATPTAVSVMTERPTFIKHERADRSTDASPPISYESPFKKLKKTMSQHPPRKLIDTIDVLRDFIKNNDTTSKEVRSSIRIQARLLWCAAETIGDYHFLRLCLGEQQAPEPLHQQQQEFQAAQPDDAFEANQYLITLSLYEVTPNNPSLPAPGTVLSFTPTKLSLYRNCCQGNAKLQSISTIDVP